MKRLCRFWGGHFLGCELALAVLLGGVLFVWASSFDGQETIDKFLKGNRGDLYGTLASVLGALLGFAIAAVSIIITVANAAVLEPLRTSRFNKLLWTTFMSATKWLGLATVASLVALCVDRDTCPQQYAFYVMATLLLISAFRTWRCVWILENVVQIVGRDGR